MTLRIFVEISHFTVLGIDTHYEIDEKKLEKAFQTKMKKFHPDSFASASKEEQDEAGTFSTFW